MVISMQTRHIVLGLALFATIIASILPYENDTATEVVEALEMPTKKMTNVQHSMPQTTLSLPTERRWQSNDEVVDIFYQAPPVVPKPTVSRLIKPALPMPPPQPVAPALPFTYFGKMTEANSTTAYLNKGGRNYAVKGGETIDGIYKIKLVDTQKVIFEYLPLQTEQTLVIRGAN